MFKNFSSSLRKALFSLILILAASFSSMLIAQGTLDSLPGTAVGKDTYVSLDNFTSGIEWVYGFLIIVTGYLSTYIPFFKNINQGVYRVLAVAVVIGAGFYFGAGTGLINLFITYTVSTSFYEVILKLLKKGTSEETPQV